MNPRSDSPSLAPRIARLLLSIPFLLQVLTGYSSAQAQPAGGQSIDAETSQVYSARPGEALVVITVFSETGRTHLDRQAVLKFTNVTSHADLWQTTDDKSVAVMGLLFGKYEIEVSAVGYLTEHTQVQANNTLNTTRIEVILHKDPSAVDLDLKEEGMPPKARGEIKHAVSALKSDNLKDAKKSLDAALNLAPTDPDINYLQGYVAFRQKELPQARTYLTAATNANSHSARALTLLGQVEMIQEDYPAAAATLEKAIEIDPSNWTAHNMLANSYLKVKNYEGARQQAELAIAKGKGAGNGANLALGQALVDMGKKDEGIQALKAFVQGSPNDPTVPQVKDLITQLENGPAPSTTAIRAGSKPVVPDPIFTTPELPVAVNPWRPAGIDESQPAVADGVSCPLDNVIQQSGERVKQLVDDVSKISAIEHLIHQQVDEMGNSLSKETRNYDYVASISEQQPGLLAVDEDRLERAARASFPDRIASGGFATLALVFHPDMRDNFEMTCEGLGNLHGQAAWLVHFKQKEDKPALISEWNIGGEVYALRLKGRAWITADKFEIIRIDSELMNPMPQIQLRCEQQVVEYGPVKFQKGVQLWLPQKAEIYLDYRKHRYYRSHGYDHYLLFSVDSTEKPNEPKVPATEAH